MRLYKKNQSGLIQPPSGVHVECVDGYIEVSDADGLFMQRCGWKMVRGHSAQPPPPPSPPAPVEPEMPVQVAEPDDLMSFTVQELLERFVKPEHHAAARKLKKADLVEAIRNTEG